MAFDAATVNANSQTGAAATNSITNRMTTSKNSLADSEQTFLALMTTQLKNQDPLSPVDSNQFTQQIVQMTGVEQQLLTNDLLSALVGMNDGGLNTSVGLIGKNATTQSSTGVLKDGKVGFDFNMPSTASTLKLEVLNDKGNVVATLDPSTFTTKGDHSVVWNGKNTAGDQQADGGVYSLKITAEDGGGTKIASTATSTSTGLVTAVSYEGGKTVVTVNGRKIPTTEIITVSEPPAPSTANNTATPPATETPAEAA